MRSLNYLHELESLTVLPPPITDRTPLSFLLLGRLKVLKLRECAFQFPPSSFGMVQWASMKWTMSEVRDGSGEEEREEEEEQEKKREEEEG